VNHFDQRSERHWLKDEIKFGVWKERQLLAYHGWYRISSRQFVLTRHQDRYLGTARIVNVAASAQHDNLAASAAHFGVGTLSGPSCGKPQ